MPKKTTTKTTKPKKVEAESVLVIDDRIEPLKPAASLTDVIKKVNEVIKCLKT